MNILWWRLAHYNCPRYYTLSWNEKLGTISVGIHKEVVNQIDLISIDEKYVKLIKNNGYRFSEGLNKNFGVNQSLLREDCEEFIEFRAKIVEGKNYRSNYPIQISLAIILDKLSHLEPIISSGHSQLIIIGLSILRGTAPIQASISGVMRSWLATLKKNRREIPEVNRAMALTYNLCSGNNFNQDEFNSKIDERGLFYACTPSANALFPLSPIDENISEGYELGCDIISSSDFQFALLCGLAALHTKYVNENENMP